MAYAMGFILAPLRGFSPVRSNKEGIVRKQLLPSSRRYNESKSARDIPMMVGRIAVISVLTLVSVFAAASDDKQAPAPAAAAPQKLPSPQETTAELAKAPPISKQTRMDLIHAFNA